MDTWKTKDGREMLVADMSDSHLLRTIRLVESRIVDLGLSSPETNIEKDWRDGNIELATDSLNMLKREADRRKLGDWGKFGIGLVKKVLD
jgi:hypothetical protein